MYRNLLSIMASAAALASSASALAQDAATDREPETMAALDRMGAALQTRMEFTVHADLTVEDVLLNGQKLQYSGTMDMIARRPDRLRINLKLNDAERWLFYDGRSLTLFAPRLRYYATAAAPGTIRETLAAANEEYGLDIPLADLFAWGTDPTLAANVQEAFTVGPETIGGINCTHHAIRQQNVDWQIWIREGEDALPCKLVITDTTDPSMPQVAAVYTWGPPAPMVTDEFTFVPPPDALPIVFAKLGTAASGSGE